MILSHKFSSCHNIYKPFAAHNAFEAYVMKKTVPYQSKNVFVPLIGRLDKKSGVKPIDLTDMVIPVNRMSHGLNNIYKQRFSRDKHLFTSPNKTAKEVKEFLTSNSLPVPADEDLTTIGNLEVNKGLTLKVGKLTYIFEMAQYGLVVFKKGKKLETNAYNPSNYNPDFALSSLTTAAPNPRAYRALSDIAFHLQRILTANPAFAQPFDIRLIFGGENLKPEVVAIPSKSYGNPAYKLEVFFGGEKQVCIEVYSQYSAVHHRGALMTYGHTYNQAQGGPSLVDVFIDFAMKMNTAIRFENGTRIKGWVQEAMKKWGSADEWLKKNSEFSFEK